MDAPKSRRRLKPREPVEDSTRPSWRLNQEILKPRKVAPKRTAWRFEKLPAEMNRKNLPGVIVVILASSVWASFLSGLDWWIVTLFSACIVLALLWGKPGPKA